MSISMRSKHEGLKDIQQRKRQYRCDHQCSAQYAQLRLCPAGNSCDIRYLPAIVLPLFRPILFCIDIYIQYDPRAINTITYSGVIYILHNYL